MIYDFGIAWEWEHDADFVQRMDRECQRRGLKSYLISPSNLARDLERVRRGELSFRVFLDRASDLDAEFEPLNAAVESQGAQMINLQSKMLWAMDKATMHLEFLSAGLEVPYTMILNPYAEDPRMPPVDLGRLGRPFVVKPAVGGGGEGVMLNAETLDDIVRGRKAHSDQKILLQRKIVPLSLRGRRGWFRVFYVVGEIIPCWWDNVTHVYAELSQWQEEYFALMPLRQIAWRIAEIVGLDFFTTEIALTPGGRFVVVDYVNEACDMRIQPPHRDGVPDPIANRIVMKLIDFVDHRVHSRTLTQKGGKVYGSEKGEVLQRVAGEA